MYIGFFKPICSLLSSVLELSDCFFLFCFALFSDTYILGEKGPRLDRSILQDQPLHGASYTVIFNKFVLNKCVNCAALPYYSLLFEFIFVGSFSLCHFPCYPMHLLLAFSNHLINLIRVMLQH